MCGCHLPFHCCAPAALPCPVPSAYPLSLSRSCVPLTTCPTSAKQSSLCTHKCVWTASLFEGALRGGAVGVGCPRAQWAGQDSCLKLFMRRKMCKVIYSDYMQEKQASIAASEMKMKPFSNGRQSVQSQVHEIKLCTCRMLLLPHLRLLSLFPASSSSSVAMSACSTWP